MGNEGSGVQEERVWGTKWGNEGSRSRPNTDPVFIYPMRHIQHMVDYYTHCVSWPRIYVVQEVWPHCPK